MGRVYHIDWSKDSWTAREQRRLNGPSTTVDDGDLDHLLLVRRIEELSLAETLITDRSIPTLSRMSGLERLDIRGTALSDSGAGRLAEALDDCEINRQRTVRRSCIGTRGGEMYGGGSVLQF